RPGFTVVHERNTSKKFLFFAADDGTNGRELWVSDGTAAGTYIVANINPGPASSDPAQITDVNGTVFFVASHNTFGRELWKAQYNTTTSSWQVTLVKDIYAGSTSSGPNSSNPNWLTNVGGTLFFTASDDSSRATYLYKTDGTAGQTLRVFNNGPYNPSWLTNAMGRLFFSGGSTPTGNYELWASDGTVTGTVLVADLYAGSDSSNPSYLVNVEGTLYFAARYSPPSGQDYGIELMRSDGTEAGTVMVRDIAPGSLSSNPRMLTNVNGRLFFVANDGVTGNELWISEDGTFSTTQLVMDINPGPEGSDPQNMVVWKGGVCFSAYEPTCGRELWRSDGTQSGTYLLGQSYSGRLSSNPSHIIIANTDTLFLSANHPEKGVELFKVTLPLMIVKVDIEKPVHDKVYRQGDVLTFNVIFMKNAFVNTLLGIPKLELIISNTRVYADYVSGSGSTSLKFRYVVQRGNYDMDGIDMTPRIDLAGGRIQDALYRDADLTFTPPDTSWIKINGVVPQVIRITSNWNTGVIRTGQVLLLRVHFDGPVNVVTSGTNRPYLNLNIGGQTRRAQYVGQPDPHSLIFRYVIQAADVSPNGIIVRSPIQIPVGVTLRDMEGLDVFRTFAPYRLTRLRVNA
ncbi:MAG: hypothetical protein RMJ88_16325, partial [Thermogemmata sp.]|nr:hypothetical protein [Thermogemmata sp.]